ncbi:hypothetical protein BJ875DRAFT_344062, partial [Amylocarpus encephaloides]
SRAGTRSVATLNAEQLDRKRKNDRLGQQEIRKRTKDYIKRLEKKVEELSDPEFDLALEKAHRKNIELEQELAWLQKLLESNNGASSQQQTSKNHHTQQQPLSYQAQEHPIPFS